MDNVSDYPAVGCLLSIIMQIANSALYGASALPIPNTQREHVESDCTWHTEW